MNVQELLAKGSAESTPQDPPSVLLARLMATERPSEVLPFVRNGADGQPLFDYRMCVLTQHELDQARASAERYTRETLKSANKLTDEQVASVRKEAWSEIYEDAKCFELLRLAMREKNIVEAKVGMQSDDVIRKYPPLFNSTKQARDLLTTDEAASLFNAYTNVQERYAPLWHMLTDAECEALIDRLVEGAGSSPFLHLGQGTLIQLVASLVFHLRALKTGTGSAGSPSDDTSIESSPSPEPESV